MSSNAFSDNLIHLLTAGNIGTKFSKINTLIHSTPAQIQAQLNVNIDKDLLSILKSFLESAEGDVEKFRKKIEEWYDELMQRISGWYKRQSRYIILGIGLLLAIIFNVDTIKICEILSTNSKARVELVNSAVNMASTYEIKNNAISDSVSKNKIDSLFNKTVKLMNTEISSTNNYAALGWSNQELSNLNSVRNWLFKLAGLMITALAISFGSDFWFNLLNKLLQLKPAVEKKIQ